MTQQPTKNDLEGMEARILGSIRDLNTHFKKSQGHQNERMDREFGEINAKLDAITEMLAMRQELRNLIRELKTQGMTLDESKIFVV